MTISLTPEEWSEILHGLRTSRAAIASRQFDGSETTQRHLHHRIETVDALIAKIERTNPVDGEPLPVFCRSRVQPRAVPEEVTAEDLKVGDRVIIPSLSNPSAPTRLTLVEPTRLSIKIRFEGVRGDVLLPRGAAALRHN